LSSRGLTQTALDLPREKRGNLPRSLYLAPQLRDGKGRGTSTEFLAMTYRANGYSNDTILSHRGCATSDVTSSSHVSDEYLSERDRQECSDMLSSLLATAAVALNTNRRVTQRCIQRAAVLLGISLSPGADGTEGRSCLQGGLASWQAKRLASYVEDKLDSTIRVSDLAGLVRLSSSHFSRAFRDTFGETPFTYVMKRRMMRAQQLMLTSRVPLSQVALACGMCDQAHFSRTFRRIVGTNPGAWRRQFLLETEPGEHASASG
jgi:AraC family transcriptional regulator